MNKKEIISIDQGFLKNVSEVLEKARKNAKTAVNLSMVYGKQLLKELSTYLTYTFGKGYSAENLKLMRRFYNVYSHDQIEETVFTQFENLPTVSTGRKYSNFCWN